MPVPPSRRGLGSVLGRSVGVAATGIATAVERSGSRASVPRRTGQRSGIGVQVYDEVSDVAATAPGGGGHVSLVVPSAGVWLVECESRWAHWSVATVEEVAEAQPIIETFVAVAGGETLATGRWSFVLTDGQMTYHRVTTVYSGPAVTFTCKSSVLWNYAAAPYPWSLSRVYGRATRIA